MKIGLLGGSFDPIHYGHIHMANAARKQFDLDEVWFIPVGCSPNKDVSKMTNEGLRFQMCKLVTDDFSYYHTLDIELNKTNTTYTYKTIETIKKNNPNDEFFFIMGADSLDYFETWMHPEKICTMCKILVINRNHYTMPYLEDKIFKINQLFKAEIFIVSCDKFHISSSEIRKLILEKADYEDYLPDKVASFIKTNNLYS